MSTPLAAPVPALPLDLARILAGAVLFVYFLHHLRQADDFSDPDGLIDHRLCARLLPATRLSLFQPGMPARLPRAVYLAAAAASLLVVIGWHPRPAAAFMFIAAVSAYRWNALVAYLDDCIAHLLCLWLVLLPVGQTLNLPDLLAGAAADSTAIAHWTAATAPGLAPRAFMANMALVYLVAGAYKFTSPMWRDGSAMHAALRMPIARAPHMWTIRARPLLRAVTWAALVLEPLFVLIFVLPPGHPAKWALLAAAAVFHLGIIATLKIPYSNALMLAALAVPMTPEIMDALPTAQPIPASIRPPPAAPAPPPSPNAPAEAAAVALLALLAIMFPWEAVRTRRAIGRPYWQGRWANPARRLLWMAGLFQSYRLFDWVDHRNHHAAYEVRRADGSLLPARDLFPNTMRHLLLQSYLIGNIWLQMTPEQRRAVRRSILVRHARRFARIHPDAGEIEVRATVQRITADNLALTRGRQSLLMRFSCAGGKATNIDTTCAA